MGKCILNHYKINCKKVVCCFECKEKETCNYKSERCFQDEFYEYTIDLGYPKICKLYTTRKLI